MSWLHFASAVSCENDGIVKYCYDFPKILFHYLEQQVAQLSQRDRAAGWATYGQKWKTVTGRQYFTDIIGPSSTTVT